jgi:hypothetical protein
VKNFLLLLLLPFLYSFSDNNNSKNVLDERNLRGKVAILEETSYQGVDESGVVQRDSLLRKQEYNYDKEGKLLEQISTSYIKDVVHHKTVNKYDEKGNLIEFISTVSEKDVLHQKTTNKYDEKGDKIESTEYNTDGNLIKKITIKYDEKGNKTMYTQNFKKGGMHLKNIEIYDKVGNILESYFNCIDSLEYNENGNMIEKTYYSYYSDTILKINRIANFKYDKNGNLLEKTDYYKNKMRFKCTYKYDENGKILQKIVFNSDSSMESKDTYKYEENGYIIETYFQDNNYPSGMSNHDKKGNIKKRTKLSPGLTLEEEEFKYDENGKIIERTFWDMYDIKNEKELYKYDEKGNIIEFNQYISNKEFPGSDSFIKVICTYKYDDNGNIIEHNEYTSSKYTSDSICNMKTYNYYNNRAHLTYSYNFHNGFIENYTSTFDENGNLIEQTSYETDTDVNGDELINFNTYSYFITLNEYVFDKTGNWIKQISRSKYNKSRYITVRSIKYY